jgi:hypothetical protein
MVVVSEWNLLSLKFSVSEFSGEWNVLVELVLQMKIIHVLA